MEKSTIRVERFGVAVPCSSTDLSPALNSE
jgi:hypothetical protein